MWTVKFMIFNAEYGQYAKYEVQVTSEKWAKELVERLSGAGGIMNGVVNITMCEPKPDLDNLGAKI